jgi:hypothetical protein
MALAGKWLPNKAVCGREYSAGPGLAEPNSQDILEV